MAGYSNINLLDSNETKNEWHRMFILAKDYFENYNDARILQSNDVQFNLASWFNDQRMLLRNGNLRNDKMILLSQFFTERHICWDIEDVNITTMAEDAHWGIMYERLLEYGKQHNGNCNVNPDYTTSSSNAISPLASWLQEQRSLFIQNKLSPFRKQKLQDLVVREQLTIVIDNDDNNTWNKVYKFLQSFVNGKKGLCNIPVKSIFTLSDNVDIDLGDWLSTQISQYHSGTLSQDRKDRLQILVDHNKLLWIIKRLL